MTDGAVVALRLVVDVGSVLVVGLLLLGAWLIAAESDALAPAALPVMRHAGAAAAAWAMAAVAFAATSTAQLLEVSVRELGSLPSAYRVAWQLPQVRAVALMVSVGLTVAVVGPRVRRVLPARLLLLPVLSAIAALAVSGHSGGSSSHFWAGQSLVVHVVAVTVWCGGLLALGIYRRDAGLLARTAPGYSRAALWCFVAVAVSGALGAWVRLGPAPDVWATPYGFLVAAKFSVLVMLGAAGALHRRRTLPRLRPGGGSRGFVLLAAGELIVMAGGILLGVVLSRTAPPPGTLTRVAPVHADTFPTVDRMIGSPGWSLLWETRANAVLLTLGAALVVAYVAGVRRLTSKGDFWPRRRVISLLAGAVLALWALWGGLGAYAAGTLSLSVARTLVLALVAAPLIAHGGPFTLVEQLTPGSKVPTALRRPVNALGSLMVLVGAVYGTGLLELTFHQPWLHQSVALAFLVLGMLFFCGILGPDAAPSGTDTHDGKVLVLVLAVSLATAALHLLSRPTLLAEQWWQDLALFWADPAEAQAQAAGLFLISAAGLATVALRMRVDEVATTPVGAYSGGAAMRHS